MLLPLSTSGLGYCFLVCWPRCTFNFTLGSLQKRADLYFTQLTNSPLFEWAELNWTKLTTHQTYHRMANEIKHSTHNTIF